MELKDAIYSRRSVRKYTDKIVDKETINELINAAVKAPSAMNAQPWVFYVIQDKDLLKELSDMLHHFLLYSQRNKDHSRKLIVVLLHRISC